MKIKMLRIGRVSLIFAMAAGCGLAQQTVPEKHVKDIQKEQPQTFISATPLCQRARANPDTENRHEYAVDRSTLLPDLKSLMQMSDEVILTGTPSRSVEAIAPSGNDAIEYSDVKVLRSWKGSHKAGDTVTYTMPNSRIFCSLTQPASLGPDFSTSTGLGYFRWNGIFEAYILFLRHAQGNELLLAPSLRMTGGSGLQGIYPVEFPIFSPLIKESHCESVPSQSKFPDDPKLCMQFLDTSDLPVFVPLSNDPISKKYQGMQVDQFLEEIQSIADSLGYPPASDDAK